MIFSDGRTVAWLALAVAMLGCGDYPRDNPFDPAVPLYLRIDGPTELTAVGETVQLTLHTSPATSEAPVWHALVANGTVQVSIDQSGRLTVNSDPALPDPWIVGARQPILVTAELGSGRRSATTLVYFAHQATGLRADDCAGHKTITLDSLHSTAPICATYVDPRGVLFQRTPVDPLYATARDSSVIALPISFVAPNRGHPNYSVERRRVGSTWVVLHALPGPDLGAIRDSVLVTVTDTVVPQ